VRPTLSGWRYELKLVCEARQIAQARSWVRLHPAGFVTAYPTRQVNNIYFDTPLLGSLNDNLSGTSHRQKLRLRWYGPGGDRVAPWVEVKEKQNMVGRKWRVRTATPIDLTEPWPSILAVVRGAVPPECPTWAHGALQPTLFNRYQRDYYWTYDRSIRATIDFSPVACDQRTAPRPALRCPLPMEEYVVIELKAPPESIDRLQEIAARFPICRGKNSKYVKGLLAALGSP